MSIDEGKNDSRIILPKINWKEEKDMNNKSKKEKETFNKIWTKRLLKFGPQKQAIKRSPTNINLYNNSLRLNKVEITTNEKIENTSIFTPVNSIINELTESFEHLKYLPYIFFNKELKDKKLEKNCIDILLNGRSLDEYIYDRIEYDKRFYIINKSFFFFF